MYETLCNHALLTPEQLGQTRQAELRAQARLEEMKKSPEFQRQLQARLQARGSGGCEDGHWISSVSNDGAIIKLEDGSIWEVDSVDTIDSTLWLPVSDIIACGDKLVNTDDGETVGATKLR